MRVPDHIVAAVNALLAPYGVTYQAPDKTHRISAGYLNWNGAVKYTGLSRSTLVRAIKRGELPPPIKKGPGKNGATVFPIEVLDQFMQLSK